jgi:hypothetical protein
MITAANTATVTPLLPRFARDGNYLFALEAQQGGPEGCSIMTAGSQPITVSL